MKNKKLSLGETLKNAFYALRLGKKFSMRLFINVIFMSVLGYFEWVFFSSVFMKKIVGYLEHD